MPRHRVPNTRIDIVAQGRALRSMLWCGETIRAIMIITSLLDTDLYKFSMMQVVLHHFPAAQVEYRYKCRTRGVDLHPYLDEIREEVHQLCQLRFTEDELNYLRGLRFIKSDFVDFLGLFHMPERCIHIAEGDAPGEISIEVRARGCTPSSSRSRCWPSSTRSISATRASIPTGKKAASGCSPRCTWCWTIRRWLISAWPNTARAAAPRSGTRKSCPP